MTAAGTLMVLAAAFIGWRRRGSTVMTNDYPEISGTWFSGYLLLRDRCYATWYPHYAHGFGENGQYDIGSCPEADRGREPGGVSAGGVRVPEERVAIA